MNGVNIIYEKCEEEGISEDELWSKKTTKRIDKALQKYIKERYEAMLSDVKYYEGY